MSFLFCLLQKHLFFSVPSHMVTMLVKMLCFFFSIRIHFLFQKTFHISFYQFFLFSKQICSLLHPCHIIYPCSFAFFVSTGMFVFYSLYLWLFYTNKSCINPSARWVCSTCCIRVNTSFRYFFADLPYA